MLRLSQKPPPSPDSVLVPPSLPSPPALLLANEGMPRGSSFRTLDFGAPGSLKYRMMFFEREGGGEVSPWHGIPLSLPHSLSLPLPLDSTSPSLPFVCSTPRGGWARLSPAANERSTPLRLRLEENSDSEFPRPSHFANNVKWNFGFFPQTWGDPEEFNSSLGGLPMNGSPIEVVEIGAKRALTGEVYLVKVICAFALVEPEAMGMPARVSWKVVAIDKEDEMAAKVEDVKELCEFWPGVVDEIGRWLMGCLWSENGRKECALGRNGRPANRDEALAAIVLAHDSWQRYIQENGFGGEGLGITPSSSSSPSLTDSLFYENMWVRYTRGQSNDAIPLSDSRQGSDQIYDRAWAVDRACADFDEEEVNGERVGSTSRMRERGNDRGGGGSGMISSGGRGTDKKEGGWRDGRRDARREGGREGSRERSREGSRERSREGRREGGLGLGLGFLEKKRVEENRNDEQSRRLKSTNTKANWLKKTFSNLTGIGLPTHVRGARRVQSMTTVHEHDGTQEGKEREGGETGREGTSGLRKGETKRERDGDTKRERDGEVEHERDGNEEDFAPGTPKSPVERRHRSSLLRWKEDSGLPSAYLKKNGTKSTSINGLTSNWLKSPAETIGVVGKWGRRSKVSVQFSEAPRLSRQNTGEGPRLTRMDTSPLPVAHQYAARDFGRLWEGSENEERGKEEGGEAEGKKWRLPPCMEDIIHRSDYGEEEGMRSGELRIHRFSMSGPLLGERGAMDMGQERERMVESSVFDNASYARGDGNRDERERKERERNDREKSEGETNESEKSEREKKESQRNESESNEGDERERNEKRYEKWEAQKGGNATSRFKALHGLSVDTSKVDDLEENSENPIYNESSNNEYFQHVEPRGYRNFAPSPMQSQSIRANFPVNGGHMWSPQQPRAYMSVRGTGFTPKGSPRVSPKETMANFPWEEDGKKEQRQNQIS